MREMRVAVLAVVLLAVPVLGFAETPKSSVNDVAGDAGAPMPAFPPLRIGDFFDVLNQSIPPDEWQRSYDAAKGRKSLGMKFILGGAGVVVAGLALVQHEENRFTDCFNDLSSRRVSGTCTEDLRAGTVVALSGASLLSWGLILRRSGSHEMARLESLRPASTKGVSLPDVPIGRRGTFAFAVGPRSSVHYRVNW